MPGRPRALLKVWSTVRGSFIELAQPNSPTPCPQSRGNQKDPLGRDYAEAWSFLRSDLIFFADGIVAAIQIDVEHGPIVAQIDLKVELQAGMCLRHGFNQGKALFDPQAKLGLIWYVYEEIVDGLVRERFGASQHHALGK